MTKQGYPRDYIEEVIASDVLNEQPEVYDDTGQNHVEPKAAKKQDIKTAPDAAKPVNRSDSVKKVNDVQNKHAEELDKDIKAAQVHDLSFLRFFQLWGHSITT